MFWMIVFIITILAIVGLLWMIGKFVERTFGYHPPKSDSAPGAAATTSSGSPSPSPQASPTPTPTPRPTAAAKKGWFWPVVIGALLSIVAIYVVIPALQAPAPSPQRATVPEKVLEQRVEKCSLQFVGGDGFLEKDGRIEVRNGGQAFFTTHTLPWRRDAVFHVVVEMSRRSTGLVWININEGRGIKNYMRPGTEGFTNVVFFAKIERGDPSYFNRGTNQIKIWSPGDEMVIQRVSVEMIYQE